jgi:hypothetical protein
MQELITLLGKCFDVLSTNKKDSSWASKYYSRRKEHELLDQVNELEELEQMDRQKNARLAFVSRWMPCARERERERENAITSLLCCSHLLLMKDRRDKIGSIGANPMKCYSRSFQSAPISKVCLSSCSRGSDVEVSSSPVTRLAFLPPRFIIVITDLFVVSHGFPLVGDCSSLHSWVSTLVRCQHCSLSSVRLGIVSELDCCRSVVAVG